MTYGQLTSQSGLRGIETGLESNRPNLYHLGISQTKRSTLSYANNNRSSAIYEDVFSGLLGKILSMNRSHTHKFKNPLYSVDATTIDLCLSLFPWATFRKCKGGIKLNAKLDHSGYIPTFVSMTTANVHELSSLKKMDFQKGSVIAFDRGYTDFELFANYCNTGIYFVTRLKKNASFIVKDRRDVSSYENISSDQTIVMNGYFTK